MSKIKTILEYKEFITAVVAITMAALNLWSIGKLAPLVQDLALLQIRVAAVEYQANEHIKVSEARWDKIQENMSKIQVDVATIRGAMGAR